MNRVISKRDVSTLGASDLLEFFALSSDFNLKFWVFWFLGFFFFLLPEQGLCDLTCIMDHMCVI